MNLSPTALAIILAITATAGSLAGVIVAGIFNHLNTRLLRRSDERKHSRDLVVKAAIEAYIAQIRAYETHQRPTKFVPLEVYLISMAKFSELFLDGPLDPETVEGKYLEMRETTRAALKGAAAGASVERE